MDAETRAGDLLDRLQDCGLGDGMNEDDLLGGAVREPLRSCCIKLAGRLWALCLRVGLGEPKPLQAAITNVRYSANTEGTAADGRLDSALARLAQALDPAFPTSGSRLEALELLTGMLQASAMAALQQDQAAAAGGIEMAEAEGGGEGEGEPMDTSDPLAYELSAALRAIASLLGLDAAAAGSAAELAAVVGARVQELLAQLPASFFEPLLPAGSLSKAQLAQLGDVDAALRSEYALRRRMLIERVNVTLQSFLWSPRLEQKGTKAEAAAVVEAARRAMAAEPAVAVQDVFSATLADLLSILEKATSGETGIHASVKGVLIGKVPDRGGRPEGRKREADMPAWTARKVTQGGGGRGGRHHHGRGGRGGRGGGGRVQGGWQGGGGSGGGGGGGWGGKGKGKASA
ncbi:hypothetical protein ABPG77_010661 [Micractinium sp. CCAP 211/92]